MKITLNDKERLEEFAKLLPNDLIIGLSIFHDDNSHYPGEAIYEPLLGSGYGAYSEMGFAKFSNINIENMRQKLYNSYIDVRNFLVKSLVASKNNISKDDFEKLKRLITAFEKNYYLFWNVASDELSEDKEKNVSISKNNNVISFDIEKSILKIGEKTIKIAKFTKQYEILRVVFCDINKDWQYSEIAEELDRDCPEKNWKNLYNLMDEIKKKIIIETGLKDVFITTTQSVLIDEKYR